jgi:hypothetical protein
MVRGTKESTKSEDKAPKKLTPAERAKIQLVSVKLHIIGASPLLMNSNRSIDEFDPEKRALTKLTDTVASKRGKNHENQVAYLDWSLRMYHDGDKAGPYMPAHNVRKAIIEGARKYSKGKTLEQAMLYSHDKCKLLYNGPRTKAGLWKDGGYVDARPVRNAGYKGGTVMRRRPKFDEWALDIEFLCDPEEVDVDDVVNYAIIAGTLIGIGDYRPDRGGIYGRFTAKAG